MPLALCLHFYYASGRPDGSLAEEISLISQGNESRSWGRINQFAGLTLEGRPDLQTQEGEEGPCTRRHKAKPVGCWALSTLHRPGRAAMGKA